MRKLLAVAFVVMVCNTSHAQFRPGVGQPRPRNPQQEFQRMWQQQQMQEMYRQQAQQNRERSQSLYSHQWPQAYRQGYWKGPGGEIITKVPKGTPAGTYHFLGDYGPAHPYKGR